MKAFDEGGVKTRSKTSIGMNLYNEAVSILGPTFAGLTHFFQRSCIFFRPMCDIPALNLNVILYICFMKENV